MATSVSFRKELLTCNGQLLAFQVKALNQNEKDFTLIKDFHKKKRQKFSAIFTAIYCYNIFTAIL